MSPPEKWGKNRLTCDEFHKLVAEICVCIVPNLFSPNQKALNLEKKKVAIAFYYPKVTGSQNMTANQFGVAQNSASYDVFEVLL